MLRIGLRMTDSNRPFVLSAREFTDLRVLDGGDTIAICFEAPDGRELALLVPYRVVSDLKSSIDETLYSASEQRAARSTRNLLK